MFQLTMLMLPASSARDAAMRSLPRSAMQAAVSAAGATVTRTGAAGCVVQLASISSALDVTRLRTNDGITILSNRRVAGFYREILGTCGEMARILTGQPLVNRPHSPAGQRPRGGILTVRMAKSSRGSAKLLKFIIIRPVLRLARPAGTVIRRYPDACRALGAYYRC